MVEGVRCRGYGLIPKAVMLDPGLSAPAKGVYAFFASFTGSGNTAFPGRDYILHALNLSKDAYYRYFAELTELDYIRVEKRKVQGRFDGNLYILVEKPSRYRETVPVVGEADCVLIRRDGLLGGGFGFIPKAVMLDTALPIKAKALYAYLSSFSGSGGTACPGKDTILYHLGIGKDAYSAALKALRQRNYVTVSQKHSGGKLGAMEFLLVDKPDPAAAQLGAVPVQAPEKQDTEIQAPDFQDRDFQLPEMQDTVFSDPVSADTAFPYPEIPDANTTRVNTTRPCKDQSYHHQWAQPQPDGAEWVLRDSIAVEQPLRLSSALCGNEELAVKTVHLLCSYDEMQEPDAFADRDDPEFCRNFYYMFVDAMIELLTDPVTELGADKVPHGRILRQLWRRVPYVESGALSGLCWDAEQEYRDAVCRSAPRFPRRFLKRLILNILTEGDLRVRGEVSYDLAHPDEI